MRKAGIGEATGAEGDWREVMAAELGLGLDVAGDVGGHVSLQEAPSG